MASGVCAELLSATGFFVAWLAVSRLVKSPAPHRRGEILMCYSVVFWEFMHLPFHVVGCRHTSSFTIINLRGTHSEEKGKGNVIRSQRCCELGPVRRVVVCAGCCSGRVNKRTKRWCCWLRQVGDVPERRYVRHEQSRPRVGGEQLHRHGAPPCCSCPPLYGVTGTV